MGLIYFLDAHSGSITAIATIILATVTIYYAKIVRDQAIIMSDNIEQDLLIRKHDRLVKEMEFLVAPLYSKIVPDLMEHWVYVKGVPYIEQQKYRSFWTSIHSNIYLGSSYLKDALKVYFENKSAIIDDHNEDKNYINARNALWKAIKQRHKELIEEINQLEKKLW